MHLLFNVATSNFARYIRHLRLLVHVALYQGQRVYDLVNASSPEPLDELQTLQVHRSHDTGQSFV